MKLLLDENLSRRLVPFLQDAFPGSSQVALLGMERIADRAVWDYAKTRVPLSTCVWQNLCAPSAEKAAIAAEWTSDLSSAMRAGFSE